MGNKVSEQAIITSFRVPVGVLMRLDRAARKAKTTRTALVLAALRKAYKS